MTSIYQKIETEIKKRRKILLHLHPSPDPDSAGSALAMYEYLKNMGKDVTLISGDSPLPKRLKFLPNTEVVINNNFFDIDLKMYDAFVCMDSGNIEQISKYGKIEFPANLFVINIDHHLSNPKFGNINWVKTDKIATGEMVAEYLFKVKTKITENMALNLIIAIYTDSGGFKYEKTSSKTFSLVSKLVKIAPDYWKTLFEMDNHSHPDEIMFKALALKNLSLYYYDQLVISTISYLELRQNGIDAENTEKSNIANVLKSVDGWEVAICVTEVEPGVCNLSLRTRDPVKYDLSKLAQALGGGGHPAASGARIEGDIEVAKAKIVEAAKMFFE